MLPLLIDRLLVQLGVRKMRKTPQTAYSRSGIMRPHRFSKAKGHPIRGGEGSCFRPPLQAEWLDLKARIIYL